MTHNFWKKKIEKSIEGKSMRGMKEENMKWLENTKESKQGQDHSERIGRTDFKLTHPRDGRNKHRK